MKSNVIRPMKGIEIWQNHGNKFWIFQAHYSANEKKLEVIDEVRSSMPSEKFKQEYEIQWDSFFGKPVYPDFDPQIHINNSISAERGLPLLLGFDFGLTPACVVCQLQSEALVILEEYTAENMGIDRLLDTIVIPGLRNNYMYWRDFKKDFMTFIDPAGINRSQTDESTCAESLCSRGFSPQPGPITWEERKQGVEGYLIKFTKKGPCLQINEEKCPLLVEGFKGGYQYPEKSIEIEPLKARPLKNKYSHPHDGLQYVAASLKSLFQNKKTKIPGPRYAFTERK